MSFVTSDGMTQNSHCLFPDKAMDVKMKQGAFYSSNATTATPTTSNTSQAEDLAALKELLGKLGVSGADVPLDKFPGAASTAIFPADKELPTVSCLP
eukprot:scaffold191_cov273-Chaetoceros_neogracile.AAC.11